VAVPHAGHAGVDTDTFDLQPGQTMTKGLL
jgi:hypothetical protein